MQRVLGAELGVKLELEIDPVRAVGELEDHPGPRVEVAAELGAPAVSLTDLAGRGVLDVGDDVGAVVEAGEIEELALVDERLVRIRMCTSSLWG